MSISQQAIESHDWNLALGELLHLLLTLISFELDMASFLQPVYNAIGLGDADLRSKVFYVTGFIASVGVIHFLGMQPPYLLYS